MHVELIEPVNITLASFQAAPAATRLPRRCPAPNAACRLVKSKKSLAARAIAAIYFGDYFDER